ncbi:MAG: ATP-binding protein, partial [Anaeromyxobacteraceae bacterium]|nr:ATP-binding protein [Anaeromyxobacteraceae bacterium]
TFTVLARSERALAVRAGAEQAAAARLAAEAIARDLRAAQHDLERSVAAWDPSRLDERELRAFLYLLAGQVPHASAAVAVDGRGTPHAFGARGEADPLLDAFVQHALQAHRASGWGEGALGLFGGGEAGVALALLREVRPRAGGRWVVAVRLEPSLAVGRLAEVAEGGRSAWLLGPRGEVLVASPEAPALAPADLEAVTALRTAGRPEGTVEVPGGHALAGLAPLPGFAPWSVLAQLPAAAAFRDLLALRRTVVLSSLTVLAVVLAAAWLLARALTRRLLAVEATARAFGAGDLAARAPEGGGDELARLARTFNAMAGEVQTSRARLVRWNEDLQAEVEARTRELVEAQAQLLEAQKLAAVGQLGAGFAHEINNPLTGILGNAQLLLERPGRSAAEREPLEAIERAARRCREITRKLLRFAERRAAPDRQEIELNRAVEEGLELVTEQVRQAGLVLERELAAPSPRVLADATQLAQLVLHLVGNARAACLGRPGARIRVRTAVEAGQAVLDVRDEGKGIPPEHLGRVFEPFFTTKELWSSVGLGLSEAWRVVDEHGGTIAVSSQPGQGSTFTVRLPAASGPAV